MVTLISELRISALADSKEYCHGKSDGCDEFEFAVHFEPPNVNGPEGLDDILFIIQLPCQIQNDLAKQKAGLDYRGMLP